MSDRASAGSWGHVKVAPFQWSVRALSASVSVRQPLFKVIVDYFTKNLTSVSGTQICFNQQAHPKPSKDEGETPNDSLLQI